MSVINVKTPNARVLYIESAPPFIEGFELVGQLKKYIDKSPSLTESNSFIYFYFFSPSSSDLFYDEDFWVAQEVIGLEKLDEQSDLELFDLVQGELYKVSLDLNLEDPESFSEICQHEKHWRREISKEHDLANTWRLRIDWSAQLSPNVDLEFFPFREEAND